MQRLYKLVYELVKHSNAETTGKCHTFESKGKEDNLCLLLIWKLVGKVGNTQKSTVFQLTHIPEIHNRNPTCLWLMKLPERQEAAAWDWGLQSQYEVKIQALSVPTKGKNPVVFSGPTAKSTCMRLGNIPQWSVNRETGNPGRKWKNNRSLADMKTEGKGRWGQPSLET